MTGTDLRPEVGGSGGGQHSEYTSRQPPQGYGTRWYPTAGVSPCLKCHRRPAFLARHLVTGKWNSFEESGISHRAMCPAISPGARRWWAEQMDAEL